MGTRLTLDEMRQGAKAPEEEVTLSNGQTVLVRGNSKLDNRRMRQQSMKVNGEIDSEKLEILMFKYGVVEPDMSEIAYEEIENDIFRLWPSADVDLINQAVLRVNGMDEGVNRREVEAFRPE